MLSTMRNFCSSAARSLRPVVCSTTVLARKAHGQAKAQPPSLPTSSGDELTLVSGELKVSYVLISRENNLACLTLVFLTVGLFCCVKRFSKSLQDARAFNIHVFFLFE